MKKTVVVFSENGARIFRGKKADAMQSHPEALVNPVFPVGVPPHLWRRQGNTISVLAMNETGRRKFRIPRSVTKAITMGVSFAAGLVTGLLF